MPTHKKYSAFSLIELMLAVSVLSIGIVLIARSFISSAGAIDTGENRMMAVNLLDGKMSEIEEKFACGLGETVEPYSREAAINGRPAGLNCEVSEYALEKKTRTASKVTLFLSWKEGSRAQDETLVTYFEKNKE